MDKAFGQAAPSGQKNSVVTLNYGEGQVQLDLAGAAGVALLQDTPLPPIEDLAEAFRRGVEEETIGTPPLRQLVSAEDEVTIVISDLTRFYSRQDKICTLLVEYLHRVIGLPYCQMVVLVALGTHRPQTPQELARLAGQAVYDKVRVVNHNCLADDLVFFGTTSRGTQVWMNPLAKGRKILNIASTIHHLMAGFGGGRKNILPGIAGKATINQNHIHSLDPAAAHSNPLIGVGRLVQNPVHEDMDEATALVAPTFGIHLLVDAAGRHTRLCCGHWREAWRESCRVAAGAMAVPITHQADVVVASCGGYPKDISLYQGCKSLLNAAQAVKPGGTMVFVAQCREGGGAEEFFGWINSLKRGTLDADLRADFSISGYIFYACCEAIAKCGRVLMLTDIAPEVVRDMGLEAYAEPARLAQQLNVAGKSVYVMPFGGNTVPFLGAVPPLAP